MSHRRRQQPDRRAPESHPRRPPARRNPDPAAPPGPPPGAEPEERRPRPAPDRPAPEPHATRPAPAADRPRPEPDPALDDTAELPILTGDPADTMEFPVVTITPPRPGVRTGPGPGPAQDPGAAAVAAFDTLYARHAEPLVRQAYLLTGRPRRAQEAVERAFRLAWQRWPEVAVDRDPVSWVRAAAHEYALSPWHGLRTGTRTAERPTPTAPAPPPADPADRALLGALLELPAPYRRALVLHDGVGLGLRATAAEVEASIRAAAGRLTHARSTVAERVPELELSGRSPDRQGAILHDRLTALAATQPVAPPAPEAVRDGSDLSVRRLTYGALGLTGLLAATTVFALVTAVWHEQPAPPPHPRASAPARPASAPGTHRPPQDAAQAPPGSPAPDAGADGPGDDPAARDDGSDAADDGDGKPVRPSPPPGGHPGPRPAPGTVPSAAARKGATPRAAPPPGPAPSGPAAPPSPAAATPKAAAPPAVPGPATPRAVPPPAAQPSPPSPR
ncbi:RNA polymerase sigma factor [Streptomyces sp. NPDC014733]|uniref:RNA polymerase sigma factor n=1 Tax=Streptomyces sp. NPDC014733 TaxID=3364885 RepID=UPI0036F706E8